LIKGKIILYTNQWCKFSIQVRKDIELSKEELDDLIRKKEKQLDELAKYGKDSNYIRELSNLAILQIEAGQFLNSEKNLLICLKHFEKQKDRLGKAAVYGVLGIFYFKKEEFQKSIDNYSTAYKIYKELDQVEEQITCLLGIGNSYIKLNQFDEACDKFFECSALCSDNNDIYNLLECMGNLIFIHETLEKWDVVFELYKKTLEAFEELNDIKGIITSYFNLGILQKKANKFDEANLYFKKGTNLAIESNFAELILKGLTYIGEILFYRGKMNSAKEQYIKALNIAEKIKANNAIIQIRIILNSFGLNESEIDEELKDYQQNRKQE